MSIPTESCADCALTLCRQCGQSVRPADDAHTVKFFAYTIENPDMPRIMYDASMRETQHLLPVAAQGNHPSCPGHSLFAAYVSGVLPDPLPRGYDHTMAFMIRAAHQELQLTMKESGARLRCEPHGNPLNGRALLARLRPV